MIDIFTIFSFHFAAISISIPFSTPWICRNQVFFQSVPILVWVSILVLHDYFQWKNTNRVGILEYIDYIEEKFSARGFKRSNFQLSPSIFFANFTKSNKWNSKSFSICRARTLERLKNCPEELLYHVIGLINAHKLFDPYLKEKCILTEAVCFDVAFTITGGRTDISLPQTQANKKKLWMTENKEKLPAKNCCKTFWTIQSIR